MGPKAATPVPWAPFVSLRVSETTQLQQWAQNLEQTGGSRLAIGCTAAKAARKTMVKLETTAFGRIDDVRSRCYLQYIKVAYNTQRIAPFAGYQRGCVGYPPAYKWGTCPFGQSPVRYTPDRRCASMAWTLHCVTDSDCRDERAQYGRQVAEKFERNYKHDKPAQKHSTAPNWAFQVSTQLCNSSN
jgi:hypothetical protein